MSDTKAAYEKAFDTGYEVGYRAARSEAEGLVAAAREVLNCGPWGTSIAMNALAAALKAWDEAKK